MSHVFLCLKSMSPSAVSGGSEKNSILVRNEPICFTLNIYNVDFYPNYCLIEIAL